MRLAPLCEAVPSPAMRGKREGNYAQSQQSQPGSLRGFVWADTIARRYLRQHLTPLDGHGATSRATLAAWAI